MPDHLRAGWSVTLALRIGAASRHWAQAVLRERKWVPADWITRKRKRTKTHDPDQAENSEAEAEAEEDENEEEPEDPDAELAKDRDP